MIDTGDKNFNINRNINIKNIRIRYQYQYQYCRIQNSISISIPISKMIKFKLNLKTIPRYLDILQSQANTQKIQASIAQLWFKGFYLELVKFRISRDFMYVNMLFNRLHVFSSEDIKAIVINAKNYHF